MNDKAILEELARRVRIQRLNAGLAQAEVASRAGISRRAVQNLESGGGCTLALLIKVLRVIGKLNQVEGFLPEPGFSPIQLAKLKGRERQRAFVPRRHRKAPAG